MNANSCISCDVELGTMADGIDQKSGTPDEVLKAFKGWDPRLVDILLCVSRNAHEG